MFAISTLQSVDRSVEHQHEYEAFLIMHEQISSLSIMPTAVCVPDDLSRLDLCPHQCKGSIWSSYSLLAPLNPLNESTMAWPINTETLTNAMSANKQIVNLSIIECSLSETDRMRATCNHSIIDLHISLHIFRSLISTGRDTSFTLLLICSWKKNNTWLWFGLICYIIVA